MEKSYEILSVGTGKSFSEVFILIASTNPQYDKRLFIELQVQYMKIASSEHVVYINCSECQNQFLYTTCSPLCSELGIFTYWTCNSMNNLSSYWGLVDAKIRASDKDLPVIETLQNAFNLAPLCNVTRAGESVYVIRIK